MYGIMASVAGVMVRNYDFNNSEFEFREKRFFGINFFLTKG
jgi:hypothetical protein